MNKFQPNLYVKVIQTTHNGPVEVVRGWILFGPRPDYNYYTILIENPYDFMHPFFVAREQEISEIEKVTQ